ncbi:MAG: hypothetical protein H6747_11415 [Deltaproteobacteria bacterium]|nr:hypothetical protein [Deltaproteobacteria bacterium]
MLRRRHDSIDIALRATRKVGGTATLVALLLCTLVAVAAAQTPSPKVAGTSAAPKAGEAVNGGDGQGAADGDEQPEIAPLSDWQDAVNAFRYQDFDYAIPRLRALLYPKVRLERAREWKAREFLGAALWWSGKKAEALDEFTALLVRNPTARLDPASYPPQIIKDFETLRSNLVRLGVLRPGQKPRPERPRATSFEPPLMLTLFPLGVGQFANGQTGKGFAFLGTEAVLGGGSVAMYLYNRDEGLSGRSSTPWRTAQVVSGGLFWAVTAWGIVDAIVVRSDLVAAARQRLKAPQAQ